MYELSRSLFNQEIGDDKYRKLEELQQLVSVTVHDIYERVISLFNFLEFGPLVASLSLGKYT